MTHYLISFPSFAMSIAEEDFPAVTDDSHAVIQEAKGAGVYVFGGGIDESVATVRVAADRSVTDGPYPDTRDINGGYAVLKLSSREEAIEWAAKIATACRCPQELREFGYDPMS